MWNPNADKHKIACLAKLVSIYIVCWDRVSFPYSFRTTNLVVDEKREKISFPHVQSVELAWLTHFFMFIDKVNLHLFVGYKYNWQIWIQLTNIQIHKYKLTSCLLTRWASTCRSMVTGRNSDWCFLPQVLSIFTTIKP